MFKNLEKAGMDRKISFHAKSCLFSPHEMFKNSGSGFIEQFSGNPPIAIYFVDKHFTAKHFTAKYFTVQNFLAEYLF
jgi:hypothetical protein